MKVDLDFTNVKSSAKVRVPEGDYIVKVKKVEKGKSSKKGTPQLKITFLFLTGGTGVEGKQISDFHYLTEGALWTLRNMLEAMGFNVPQGKMKFDDKMVMGRKVGITVIDGEEYKGRISSEIADYVPADVVGNLTTAESSEDEEDEDDGFLDADDEDEVDEDSEDEDESDDDEDSDDEGFSFDDDEDEEDEDEEEEVALSFDADDVTDAKAASLKAYVKEAQEAGFEFDLPSKPKAAQVREALLSIFADEAEDDDDEMEDFDLDDVE